MSDAYITLWSQPQVELQRRLFDGSDRLDHTAGSQFRTRGVAPGDRVYVVAIKGGHLLLLGRLVVERVVDQYEAERFFGSAVYDAPDHLIGTGTALNLDRVVPEHIVRKIERDSGRPVGIAPDEYRVDVHSLRSTGRITTDSAALFDTLLENTEAIVIDVDYVGRIAEGERREVTNQTIERSSALRERALKLHGTDCRVCSFSFGPTYGTLGDGYAEVHHLTPLSAATGEVRVSPATDVVVVCANCHRMLHRQSPPLAPEALRRLMSEVE